jgi:hypothetical protein
VIGDGRTERRRFALWAGGALIVLLPLWWWLGAGLVASLLRPAAALVGGMFGLEGFTPVDGDWRIGTPYTTQGAPYVVAISPEQTRRFLLSFPILASLLIAPPRIRMTLRATVAPLIFLLALFAISPTLLVYGELAPLLDPTRSITPGVSLDQPPLPDIVAQIVILGRYLVLTVLPLLAPVLAWAAVNREARELFFSGLSAPPTK